ncbi:hypothetical protein HELRODRAFT_189446 [Helobdella robusta]|uniref:RING-type domain-containing protein n=1 Tax=Helobdella robusta TaxID=6412 RepID=T1FR25_HELRO|nr:hypothetical protein HELRODRAFT_189446 [Helobdella robusta]ESN94598.1 hypothetical protein HELRODRAFT_189446 [Helobdella robusta]
MDFFYSTHFVERLKKKIKSNTDDYLEYQLKQKLKRYRKFLNKNMKEYNLTKEEIKMLPIIILLERQTLLHLEQCIIGDEINKESESSYLSRIRTLPVDIQYQLMKDMQDYEFDKCEEHQTQLSLRDALSSQYVYEIRLEGIRRLIIDVEDSYFLNLAKNRRYRLPYIKGKFLHDDCGICKEKFVEGRFIHELNCNHAFHFNCIDLWLKMGGKNSCPYCRQKVVYGVKLAKSYETYFDKSGGDLFEVEPGHCISNARHLNHYTIAPPKL